MKAHESPFDLVDHPDEEMPAQPPPDVLALPLGRWLAEVLLTAPHDTIRALVAWLADRHPSLDDTCNECGQWLEHRCSVCGPVPSSVQFAKCPESVEDAL